MVERVGKGTPVAMKPRACLYQRVVGSCGAKTTCKPDSVTRRMPRGGHLSSPAVADGVERPTRGRVQARIVPLFGLAPGGVYQRPASPRGLVRSYRTVSPLPVARRIGPIGGLVSVALPSPRSLEAPGSYPAPCLVESGLSSSA